MARRMPPWSYWTRFSCEGGRESVRPTRVKAWSGPRVACASGALKRRVDGGAAQMSVFGGAVMVKVSGGVLVGGIVGGI